MAQVQPHPTILLREQIVQAALSLVEGEGLEAITMRTLARRLGYSPASLYMHFRGKEELLRAVAAQTLGTLLERTERAAKREDPAEGLRAFAEQLLCFARESHALDRLIFDETPGSPYGTEEEALRGRLFQSLAGLVARGAAAAALPANDPALAAALAWGELRGIARLVRPEGPDPAPAREVGSLDSADLAREWARRWLRNA